jgi:hypothetical protein
MNIRNHATHIDGNLYHNPQWNLENMLRIMCRCNNPDIAYTRMNFYYAEHIFFRKHIKNQSVLVAGSGFGMELLELSQYNKSVIGLEINPVLAGISRCYLRRDNIKIVDGDFMDIKYKKEFDSSILNMGTIGNFDDEKKIKIIKELKRVSTKAYIDFYTAGNIAKRLKMYREEGWKNPRVESDAVISDDGLYSETYTIRRFKNLVKKSGYEAKIYPMLQYAWMAEI